MGRLNDGSEKGEDARRRAIRSIGFRVCGGSDSQPVSFIDVCATEFTAPIRALEVREVRKGRYRPAEFPYAATYCKTFEFTLI